MKTKLASSQKLIIKLLEGVIEWPDKLEPEVRYERVQDDHDGTFEGKLQVTFSQDGDAWVTTDKHRGPSMRFRNAFGGTASPRTRNALLILALAMKLDSEPSRS